MKPEHSAVFTKPEPPRTSWWLSQQTREDFIAAHQRQLERMKRDGRQSGGEMRVVGTLGGKV